MIQTIQAIESTIISIVVIIVYMVLWIGFIVIVVKDFDSVPIWLVNTVLIIGWALIIWFKVFA